MVVAVTFQSSAFPNKMMISARNLLYLLLLLLLLKSPDSSSGQESGIISDDIVIGRSDFPDQFVFGASTSAYQVEGGYLEDGKGINNWDAFFISRGRTQDRTNGDVADDHYHRYPVLLLPLVPYSFFLLIKALFGTEGMILQDFLVFLTLVGKIGK
ncbi:unnamed protein product [Cuscuta campestris]|uniref:Beta-glucosidase n=1 Tax=Cuscuta campestris TaxID=132261 RepID=A0A484MV53_9ASTE|nr:unnamed protein product [Cuscuta campestris]